MTEEQGYFNDTPVKIIRRRDLDGEPCVLVLWPNGDRSWLFQGEVFETPKSERDKA